MLVTSSTFSCLIAELIWVRFSAGGAAVAEVAALPVVLLSAGLVSALGVFMSFEIVVVSDAFALVSVFSSFSAAGILVSALGLFMSFEAVPDAFESDALDLPSTLISPVVFASGLLCTCWGACSFEAAPGVAASLVGCAFIGAEVSALGQAVAGD